MCGLFIVRYNNKTYRVHDIAWTQNPLSTFKLSDGTETSYADYFQNVRVLYQRRLTMLSSPVILPTHSALPAISPVIPSHLHPLLTRQAQNFA